MPVKKQTNNLDAASSVPSDDSQTDLPVIPVPPVTPSNGNGNGFNGTTINQPYSIGNSANQMAYSKTQPTIEETPYYSGETITVHGLLEILPDYGVIRQREKSEDSLPRDVYISLSQIKRFNLRRGDSITGLARPPKEGERYLSLVKIEKVEGMDPEKAKKRPYFTELTPIFPDKWIKLETKPEILTTRLIDLVAPIGRDKEQ